jgi:pyruvate/2-oxoglutarate dehydrogenase complex dihydrolipoamide acyltransferase (E2) component
MPALSPTMTEGIVTRWAKQEGDAFAAGDILFEVETDKAQIEVEAQDDGRVAKIIAPSGSDKVRVNAPIAYITDDPDEDVANFVPPKRAFDSCLDFNEQSTRKWRLQRKRRKHCRFQRPSFRNQHPRRQ